LVGATVVAQLVGTHFQDRYSAGNTPSQQALNILESRFPAEAGDSAQVVFQTTAPFTAASNRDAVDALAEKLRAEPDVAGVASPFAPGGSYQISRDGHIGYLTVDFTTTSDRLPASAINRVIHVAQASAHPGFRVELGGNPISSVVSAAPGPAEGIGVTAAIVIMLLAFGSVVAMGLPILVALIGLATGIAIEELGTHLLVIPTFAPELAAMMGLGVGIDYSLLIVTRYRQYLGEGLDPESAVVAALTTSGRAVLIAGGTVVVSLLGRDRLGAARPDRIADAAAGDARVRGPVDGAFLDPAQGQPIAGHVGPGLLVPVEPDHPAPPMARLALLGGGAVVVGGPVVLDAARLQRRRQRPDVAHHQAGLRPVGPGLRARVQRSVGHRGGA
jgi:RND superfamily putative drug exporter